MARHLDRIAGVWDAISAAEGPSRSASASTPATPGRAASSWPPRWRRSAAITGRIDLVHANDSRDAFDSGADRHANFGDGPARRATSSRASSATPAPRSSARPPAAPRSTGPTSRGCASTASDRSRAGRCSALGGRGAASALRAAARRRRPRPRPTCRSTRIDYGEDHAHQFVDLRLPAGDPGHGRPAPRRLLAARLRPRPARPARRAADRAGLGHLERRVPPRSARRRLAGHDDRRRAGVDRLARRGRGRGPVVAARSLRRRPPRRLGGLAHDATPGGAPLVQAARAISLSGVLDLTRAARRPGLGRPVDRFAGGSPRRGAGALRLRRPHAARAGLLPGVGACTATDDAGGPARAGRVVRRGGAGRRRPPSRWSSPATTSRSIDPEAAVLRRRSRGWSPASRWPDPAGCRAR